MKCLLTLLCTGFFWSFAHSQDHFFVSMDAAQFRDSQNHTYVELYYSVPQNAVTWQKNSEDTFSANILLNIQITHHDTLYAANVWRVENSLADTASLESGQQVVDLLRYPLDPGESYHVTLYAQDVFNPESSDSVSMDILAENYTLDQVLMSDVQVATDISGFQTGTTTSLQKGSYQVIPQPGLSFGTDSHSLFYYFELYNLNLMPGDYYHVQAFLADTSGQSLENQTTIDRRRPLKYDTSREIGKVDISGLSSGLYVLNYQVTDEDENIMQAKQKTFFVISDQDKRVVDLRTNEDLYFQSLGFFDGFTKEQLDLEFDKLSPFLNPEQKRVYDGLGSIKAKKTMLYRTWHIIRDDPAIPVQLFRNKYLARVAHADERYKTSFRPGWKTDKGIVFLKYGNPSDIERNPSVAGTKPYEIWKYESLEGGAIFVFIDRQGFNRYELVHSTKRGEMYDPNWKRLIDVNQQGTMIR